MVDTQNNKSKKIQLFIIINMISLWPEVNPAWHKF